MRKIVVAVSALVVALWAPSASAIQLPFNGFMDLYVYGLPPTMSWYDSGTVVVNGSAAPKPVNSIALAPGQFATNGKAITVSRTSAAPIRGLMVTAANGPGAFERGGAPDGRFGGQMPLLGTAKVCLFGTCSAAVANLKIPLSVVGRGGQAFATAAVNVTVRGAPWTTGTVLVDTLTSVHRGHVNSSPPRSIFVGLVTPIFISTNIAPSAVIGAFASLNFVAYTPEPATIVLLSAGICGLLAYGRLRRGATRQ